MPTSEAPTLILPPWAVGLFAAGPFAWSGLSRRDPAGFEALAAAGFEPDELVLAEMANEFLGRVEEWTAFYRGETATAGAGLLGSIYGDGDDGDVTLGAGTTTLARDTLYANLTVPAGSTLAVDGFRVFVAGLLTVAVGGVISCDGGNAVLDVAGAGTPQNVLGGGSAGATGVQNVAGSNGTAGSNNSTTLGNNGGAGGNTTGFTGGAGGTATAPTAINGSFRHLSAALGRTVSAGVWRGGAGGGSGAVEPGGPEISGGGGGGAGVLALWARLIDNSGIISCNGGNGGDGQLLGGLGAGGGGGGGGGGLFIVHRETVGGTLGTVTVTGGTAGLGFGNGLNGVVGVDGSTFTFVG